MKTFLIMTLVFVSSLAKAVTVEDLKIDCQGTLKVVEVGKSHFSPEQPPRGRFSGRPASGYIEATVHIQEFKNVQCELLKTKYGFSSAKLYSTEIAVANPLNAQHVESLKSKLLGQEMNFKTDQSFGFVWNEKYLPLYPHIHSENIWLSGNANVYSIHLPIHFDEDGIQNFKLTNEWSEEEKIELAFKLASYQNLAKNYSLSDLNKVFLGLTFEKQENVRKHFLNTWKLLKDAIGKASTRFFDFDVGGEGSFVGAPFAHKLIVLANATADKDEKLELIHQFPSLLKPGFFANVCLDINAEDFKEVLQKWNDQLEALSAHHQNYVEKVLYQWGQPWSGCLDSLKSPENDQLVQEIRNKKVK